MARAGRTAVTVPELARPGVPVSPGLRMVPPAGGWVLISGQVGVDPVSGELAGGDVATQTWQCLCNLRDVLAKAGAGLDTVVKTTAFLTDMTDYPVTNEVYAELFDPPWPTSSAVGVLALVAPEYRVEIEAWAMLPDTDTDTDTGSAAGTA